MAYGLNELEAPLGSSLQVGRRDGWQLHLTQAGLKISSVTSPCSQIGTQLNVLAQQAYCDLISGKFEFTFDQVRALRNEDKGVLGGFCETLPCTLHIKHFRNLGNPDFRLSVEFLTGNTRVHPEILGPIARLEGKYSFLPDEMWNALDRVRELNLMPAADKEKLPEVLRTWAQASRAIQNADGLTDEYLRKERVVEPSVLNLDMNIDPERGASLVPTVPGVDRDELHRSVLLESEIANVYNVPDPAGGRVRVVINEEVGQALEAIRLYRHLSPEKLNDLLADPSRVIPDGFDSNLFDMSLFGPRVREIGLYPATVRPFKRHAIDWAGTEDILDQPQSETDESDDHVGREGEDGVEVGIELGFVDGSSEFVTFDSLSEAQELGHQIEDALEQGFSTIEFRDKPLGVSKRLLEAIRTTEGSFEANEQNVDSARPRTATQIGPISKQNDGEDDADTYVEADAQRAEGSPESLPASFREDLFSLKPHQKLGFEWLVRTAISGKRGALLADDMGLGKTIQALALMAVLIEQDLLGTGLNNPEPPYKPLLVVAPVILLDVWKDEIQKFFDDSIFLPYSILDSARLNRLRKRSGREGKLGESVLDLSEFKKKRLVITNYDSVANYAFSFAQIRWSAVISDESHTFKEPSTRISHVMKSLQTEFRLAMTGTPVVNRLMDVWNLVDFLRPLHLGSQKEFRNTFELHPEDGGPTRGAQLLQRALNVRASAPVDATCVVLRRSKEKELPGLPRKIEHLIKCELTDDQISVYREVRAVAARSGSPGRMLKLLASLNRLLQHPALEGRLSLSSSAEELISASPKIQELIKILGRIRAKREKALVFAISCDMQYILKRVLDDQFDLDVKIINGQTSAAGEKVRRRRLATIDEFSSVSGFNVMVLSPDVAGVGLTIIAANHVCHFGRWWNPAREDQATDRTHRIGQEKDVHVYRLLCVAPAGTFKTFDEHLDDLINERRQTARHFLVPSADEDAIGSSLGDRVFESSVRSGEEPISSLTSKKEIDALSPDFFEALTAAWVESRGYSAFLTPYAGDAGVDIVGISEDEAVFVQAKHVQSGRGKVDQEAAQQIRNGMSHYLESIFPPALRSLRPRLEVVSNGKASGPLDAALQEFGASFVGRGELVAAVKQACISHPDIRKHQLSRFDSLQKLKEELKRKYPSPADGSV